MHRKCVFENHLEQIKCIKTHTKSHLFLFFLFLQFSINFLPVFAWHSSFNIGRQMDYRYVNIDISIQIDNYKNFLGRYLFRFVDRYLFRFVDRYLSSIVDRYLFKFVDRYLFKFVESYLFRFVDRYLFRFVNRYLYRIVDRKIVRFYLDIQTDK